MTIQDLINWLRNRLRQWLGVEAVDLKEIYDALFDEHGHMIRSLDLRNRIKEVEDAYAEDPRRAEIAKEKAEAPTVISGFMPRSVRRSRWEAERKAKPKE